MAQTLGIAPNVIFTGKMTHDELLPILSKSKALLVNTVKDNNMIFIVEAITVGTPMLITGQPTVFLLISLRRFPMPAPGMMPVSQI